MSTCTIESADDPRLAEFRDFRDPIARRRQGLFAVEGLACVRILLARARFRPHSLLATPSALRALAPLLGAIASDVPVYQAAREVTVQVAGVRFHQGCLALVQRPPDAPAHSLFEVPGARLLLFVEDVTDPDNIGGLFRSAAAFGVDGVVLSPRAADPLYRKAIRTSLGASLWLPFARSGDWEGDLERARAAGWTRVALTPDPDAEEISSLGDVAPLALIAGNEGSGLRPSTLESAERRARIAMVPGADSLNVATAVAIALHRIRSDLAVSE
ncbi:MAG: TrmH family RNA methyltransferase [Myxococcota bacterium]